MIKKTFAKREINENGVSLNGRKNQEEPFESYPSVG